MKQRFHVFLLIFLFAVILLFHSTTSARLLQPNQDNQRSRANGISQEDSLSNLMGLEECTEEDEECLKRRMVAEAHLDYIYTQHHQLHHNKPKP